MLSIAKMTDDKFDKPHVRLRKARLAAGFKTAKMVLEKFKWNGSTYRAHENGQNAFSADQAAIYAQAFGVSANWLFFGDAEDTKNNTLSEADKVKSEALDKSYQQIQSALSLLNDDPKNLALLEKLHKYVEDYFSILNVKQ